jgi:RNA polymerase sigma factor (sigma-70 family)
MEIAGHRREQIDPGRAEREPARDDQERFATRFEACRPSLAKLCQRILSEREAARDAVNETYLRAFGNRATFDGQNFPGWLSRIAKRICLDQRRREFPGQRVDVETELASSDSEVRMFTAMQIRSILAQLPERQRMCLKLFYIEGLTAKEVAKKTGFGENQVKSYLQNGRRNFMLAWRGIEGRGNE